MRRWEDYVGWNSFDWSAPLQPNYMDPPGPITNEEVLEVSPAPTWVVFRDVVVRCEKNGALHGFSVSGAFVTRALWSPFMSASSACHPFRNPSMRRLRPAGGGSWLQLSHDRPMERRCGKIRNTKWKTWTGGCGSCYPGKPIVTLDGVRPLGLLGRDCASHKPCSVNIARPQAPCVIQSWR